MHPEYLPSNLTGMLDHCVEEFGEALAALGKYQRFGPLSTHPNGGPTNIETLILELEDAQGAAVRALVELKAQFASI